MELAAFIVNKVDPCKNELINCMDEAYDVYIDHILKCNVGGLGLSALTGPYGFLFDVGCLSWNAIHYKRAKGRCDRSYSACNDI